jgi:hypothetical protein
LKLEGGGSPDESERIAFVHNLRGHCRDGILNAAVFPVSAWRKVEAMNKGWKSPVLKATTLACFVAFSGTFSARAQAPKSERPVQVYAASRFINEAPRTVYSVNEQIKVKIKPGGMEKLKSTALQVRVFRGTAEELVRTPWTQVGDCYVYLSTVYPISISSARDQIIVEGGVVDLWWLTELNGKLQRQEWLLVLEDTSFSRPEIKLKKTEVEDYFGLGYVFIASPGNASLKEQVDSLRSWFKESYDELKRLRQYAQQTEDCLRYADSSEDRRMLAALASC